MPSLKFEKVIKRYNKSLIINNLSFEAPDRKVTVILGPSGAGKTTILRLITGLEKPDHGTILFDDSVVSSPSCVLAPRKRKVGMVFQDLALWPHLTIQQNIMFVMNKKGRKSKKSKTLELLTMVGLKEKARNFPSELSGGEKQRIAIVRALASDPEILLLDEPFSNLEKSLRENLIEEFKRLISSLNLTVVYVTHNQDEGFSVGEKIVIIKDGLLHQEGDKEDVFFNPKDLFTAEFLGYKSIVDVPIDGRKLLPTLNGKIYAYRPEDIVIEENEPKKWQVMDNIFKNGQWLSKLLYDNVTIYAHAKKRHDLKSFVGIKVLRKPSIINNE